MKIRLTKTGKIIIFVILGIVVLGSSSYLLWRVLQPQTIAPEDSDAGGGGDGGGCCLASYVNGSWMCPVDTWTARCAANPNDKVACFCKNKSKVNRCGSNRYCLSSKRSEESTCNVCEGEPLPPSQDCYGGSDCDACAYPNVGFCISGKCTCKHWSTTGLPQPCESPGETFSCKASCPSGQEECGSDHTGCSEVREDCTCSVCKNKSYATIWCKDAPANTCSGEAWIEQPSGKKTYCSKFGAIAQASDTDGIDLSSIKVTLGGDSVSLCPASPTSTCYTTSESGDNTRISVDINEYTCLSAGEYILNISWSDSLGASGDDCALSTTFEMEAQPKGTCGDGILDSAGGEQCELGDPDGYQCSWDTCNQTTCICPSTNPEWSISKVGVESCIEDGESVEGRATYTITVTNIGDAQGNIDRLVDNLDSKVIASYLNDISGVGTYTNGQITWDLEGEEETFSVGETQTFTYYIQVPSSVFGTYENTVTAYPSEGDNFSAQVSVEIDCEIEGEIPQTGIFDSSIAKMVAGMILILVGIGWNKANLTLNFSVKEYVSDQRIKRFENKVAKKK
ncbi:DUF11 domain-containing protein [bacterium]|nr:DUF11 domain-containing protein [bacterium]